MNEKDFLNQKYNKITTLEQFAKFIEGKKVAIIGPAPSVKDVEDGYDIEREYDLIIRINKQWKHHSDLDKYIGKRTDILYHCMDPRPDCGGSLDFDYLFNNNLQYIISTIKYDFNNKQHRDKMFHCNSFLNWYYDFHIENNNRIKFLPIDSDFYDHYDKLAQTRINTGLMAILHLMQFKVQKLYIKGFTFFLDGYLLDYRSIINNKKCIDEKDTKEKVIDYMVKKNSNHNQQSQWELFKKVYHSKKTEINILLDPKLQQIVEMDQFPEEI